MPKFLRKLITWCQRSVLHHTPCLLYSLNNLLCSNYQSNMSCRAKYSSSTPVSYVTLNMVVLGGHPELCWKSVSDLYRQFLQFFKGILPGRSFGIWSILLKNLCDEWLSSNMGGNPIILFLPGLVAYMMHEISYFDRKVTDASMEQDYKMEHRFRIFWL